MTKTYELPEVDHLRRLTPFVEASRQRIRDVMSGADDRLLVVIGPCSIHNADSALRYASLLQTEATRLSDHLLVVMRAYLEKPRTTVGWRGFLTDPRVNGSNRINEGLHVSRFLLQNINSIGLPLATEFLDPVLAYHLQDQISWGAIGARTVESQTHRGLASSLSLPIGFKNGTSGNVQVAVDAMVSAANRHLFPFVEGGVLKYKESDGNHDTHVILRGSSTAPNYLNVKEVSLGLVSKGLNHRVMVDCSHGNSLGDYLNQIKVVDTLSSYLSNDLLGVMIESHLTEGKFKSEREEPLPSDQSITDACLGWEQSVQVLNTLHAAARQRHLRNSSK